MKQSKSELRAALLNDQLTFLLQGNRVTEIPAQAIKIKSLCRSKESRGKPVGGNIPRFSTQKYSL